MEVRELFSDGSNRKQAMKNICDVFVDFSFAEMTKRNEILAFSVISTKEKSNIELRELFNDGSFRTQAGKTSLMFFIDFA
jgi:hypothetical protein